MEKTAQTLVTTESLEMRLLMYVRIVLTRAMDAQRQRQSARPVDRKT